jgi:TRAP-type uncharacterized transport system substrate-binding protein
MVDQPLERTIRSKRRLRWLAAALTLPPLALAMAVLWVRPAAPRAIRLCAGPAGTAESSPAARFAAAVRERGLAVDLVAAAGPEECLRLVAQARGDAAALVGGGAEDLLGDAPGGTPLSSLGTVAIAPIWLFAGPSLHEAGVRELAGRRVGSGPAESPSGLLATLYFRDNGLDPAAIVRVPVEQGGDAAAALATGQLDAVFVAGLPGSPAVRPLLESSAARPVSFERATAFRVRHPWLLPLTVPRGVFDLAQDNPPADLQLLATGVNVVVPKRMHAAAVKVLLDAAREAARGGTQQPQKMIAERFGLPTPEYTTLPLNSAAQAYYEKREERDLKHLVFRLLPYGVARWLDRWGILLAAAAASLFGRLKVLPWLTKTYFTLHLGRAYRAMAALENSLMAPGADRAALLARLAEIDQASLGVPVPRRMGQEYMDFRQFLHDLRSRLEALPENGRDGQR